MNIEKNKIMVCLLFTVIIVLLLNGCGNNTDQNVNVLVFQGQNYIKEANYKNALSSFDEALKLDDQCVEAYIGAADAYAGLEDYGMAIDILVRGFEKTNNEIFQKR